jgi:hypothetical protein
MAGVARIPRRRGGLCGLLLILVGAWGALVPFIGPYLKFAYTPDTAMHYTTGRLYLSVIPGAIAVLTGLLVLATRSRGIGVLSGLIAAVAGAWFLVGAAVTDVVLKRTSISPGVPVVRSMGGIPAATWVFLEQIGFFVGVGMLIIFFGALAMGRFSMISASDPVEDDYEDYPEDTTGTDDDAPASTQFPTSAAQFPSATGQFPSPGASTFPGTPRPFPGEESTQTQDRVPSTGQFPPTASQFPRPGN